MKSQLLIAIDSGKYGTKGVMLYNGKEHYVYFRTKMQEVNKLDIELYPGSYYVKFNQKSYLIGDMVDESYSNYDLSKENDLHKICVYVAITELLKKASLKIENVDIRLAVNIPISSYKDGDTKKRYIQFMENYNNTIMIEVNNSPLCFKLENVIAVFEGTGSIFHDMKSSISKNTAIIDIGGLNSTFCQFSGLTPDFNSMIVANSGVNILKGKVGRAINEKFGIAVTPNDLELILQQGFLMHQGQILLESHDIIERIKQSHFDEIINFAKSRNYTFNNTSIQFCGGGSLLLKSIIEKQFPNANIVVNPQFANVKSFLQILKVKNNL
ncbi:hypothetical protein [Lysinibacillus capsici]|uniref:ParM/StbA family protein n=1 Tax=Lysinibacillus capsici TaxID=2115968 RepID=UPI003D74BF5E